MKNLNLIDIAENVKIIDELVQIFIDARLASFPQVTQSRTLKYDHTESPEIQAAEFDRVKILLTRSLLIRIQQIQDEENRRNAYHPATY
ncbi:MAG: hypothetical protein ACK5PB_14020 [Pirellula sp.]|jgi:hypothetical protein